MKTHVTTDINDETVEFLCEPQHTLLHVLRNELGLTGTKEGCGSGDCGACSVTVNGRLVCACLVLAVEADGAKIGTIEARIQGRRRPMRGWVRSLQKPTTGSEIASQIRDRPKIVPIAAGEIPSTSVANFNK